MIRTAWNRITGLTAARQYQMALLAELQEASRRTSRLHQQLRRVIEERGSLQAKCASLWSSMRTEVEAGDRWRRQCQDAEGKRDELRAECERLVQALMACAKANSAAEVGLIVDDALAAHREQGGEM